MLARTSSIGPVPGRRHGVAEVGVLFEHVPAGVAGALEGDDGVVDRRVAAAERAEQPVE